MLVGQPIASLLEGKLASTEHVRIINGNPLTGRKCTAEDFVGGHTSEITAIPEGDNVDEMLGWILPRTNDFSVNRSYFSWLLGKNKEYSLDARVLESHIVHTEQQSRKQRYYYEAHDTLRVDGVVNVHTGLGCLVGYKQESLKAVEQAAESVELSIRLEIRLDVVKIFS